jgi:hypothetical protein
MRGRVEAEFHAFLIPAVDWGKWCYKHQQTLVSNGEEVEWIFCLDTRMKEQASYHAGNQSPVTQLVSR